MKKPAIKIKYVLVCDDARSEENTGKSFVIGLYNEDIVLPEGATEFIAPLTFLVSAQLPRDKTIPVKLWIEGPEGQHLQESDFGPLEKREGVDSLSAQLIWRIFPWRSSGVGTYKLHMTQGALDEVIHQFGLRGQT